MAWTYLMEDAMPVPGEHPICHYTGERCKYEGAACTCLLPGFVGMPPTWASDGLRAELDKLDLTPGEKETLLRRTCASGIKVASEDKNEARNRLRFLRRVCHAELAGLSRTEALRMIEWLEHDLGAPSPIPHPLPAQANDGGKHHGS